MKPRTILTAAALATLSAPALAHPGHGSAAGALVASGGLLLTVGLLGGLA